MIDKIKKQWLEDKKVLPLIDAQESMYMNAQSTHYSSNGCLFDIQNPKTLNDKIQWTKFFDQQDDCIRCTDKLGVKEYVKEILGKESFAKVLWESDSLFNFREVDMPKTFVIKTNNDSGTTFIIKDKNSYNFSSIFGKINNTLNSCYGKIYGEWSYEKIKPKVFVEEYLDDLNYESAADYKFFCGKGEVFFCHYIYNRGHGTTTEQIIDSSGNETGMFLDPNFKKGSGFNKPSNWDVMIDVASKLSKKFKLVRIDLYSTNDEVYVGEITFWPYAGIYKGEDQKKISKLINLDTSSFIKPITK